VFSQPQSEHQWFDDMLGEWDFDHECQMGPDQPPTKSTGTINARSLGGLWIQMDCKGGLPDGNEWNSIFTLGFDPHKGRYLGTFIASMMTHLWIYDGAVDTSGKRLIMDVEGPSFDGKGMANYQDIFEIVDRNHWILRSRLQQPDGTWIDFLEGHHRRRVPTAS
jgi:hypothetical protein